MPSFLLSFWPLFHTTIVGWCICPPYCSQWQRISLPLFFPLALDNGFIWSGVYLQEIRTPLFLPLAFKLLFLDAFSPPSRSSFSKIHRIFSVEGCRGQPAQLSPPDPHLRIVSPLVTTFQFAPSSPFLSAHWALVAPCSSVLCPSFTQCSLSRRGFVHSPNTQVLHFLLKIAEAFVFPQTLSFNLLSVPYAWDPGSDSSNPLKPSWSMEAALKPLRGPGRVQRAHSGATLPGFEAHQCLLAVGYGKWTSPSVPQFSPLWPGGSVIYSIELLWD